MRDRSRASESGFTLIEVLVALGVFAIAGLALLQLTHESTRSARALDVRFLAEVEAENLLAETYIEPATLVVGVVSGRSEQRGRQLDWTRTVAPTPRNGLLRVEVAVTDVETGQTLIRLNALRPER